MVRDAKTGESKSATFLPENQQNQEDLITVSDKLEVKWSQTSSFFIFAVWHADHFDVLGVILARSKISWTRLQQPIPRDEWKSSCLRFH